MKVRGIVRNGVIVTEGEPLPEGARVSVQLDEDTAPGLMTIELDENGDVIVTPELEAELAAAEAEADLGEGIPLEEFLEELRSWR